MGNLTEFEAWPKTPRLSKPIVVTEKIDGTNAAVVVRPLGVGQPPAQSHEVVVPFEYDDESVGDVAVYGQSRKRIVFPGQDNAGFAAWVHANAQELAQAFGPGRHFGEWWGNGIQRGYGVEGKFFSPFNVSRWDRRAINDTGLYQVGVRPTPVLGHWGTFESAFIDQCVDLLILRGSQLDGVVDGTPAEGVIVYHSASGQLYKRLIEGDNVPKSVLNEQFATAG